MKIRSIILVSLILSSAISFAQQKKATAKAPQKSQPKTIAAPIEKGALFFDKTSYDFKSVDEDMGRTFANFTFTNIGKGNIKIIQVDASCGCTTAEWDREKVYKQSEKGRITINYNPKNMEGDFIRTITVITDGDPEITYLTISGNVYGPTKQLLESMPFLIGKTRLSTNIIDFPKAKYSKPDSVEMRIYNTSDQWMRVTGVVTPAYVKSTVYTPFIEPKSYSTISVKIIPELAKVYGPIEDYIYINTDEKPMANKKIAFKAFISEDFSTLTPKELKAAPKLVYKEIVKDLGEVYYGEVVDYDFEFINQGKSDLILRRAYGTCGCTVASIANEPIKKGKTGKVSVRFDAKNLYGDQVKSITVISNDPNAPITTLTIKAKLVEDGAIKKK